MGAHKPRFRARVKRKSQDDSAIRRYAAIVDTVVKHYADSGFYCGFWRQVCFQVWSGDATEERLRRLRDMFATRTDTGPVLVLTRLMVSTKMYKVEANAKPIIADISERFAPRTKVSVQVVEQGGFVGAAARAVLTTLSYLQKAKTHTVSTMDAGADLIMACAEGRFSREELLAAAAEALAQWQAVSSPQP